MGTDAARRLQDALTDHYDAWVDAQRQKADRFVEDALAAGLESMHEPPRWRQGSARFLSEDDPMQRPQWLSHDDAVEEIRGMIEDALAERGVETGYQLQHAERDFAKGYRPFVSFRLCCDEDSSLQRWKARQAERAQTYVAEAVHLMLASAEQGNAEVWAKVPNGRYSNFLTKDEPWPTWIGRDAAVEHLQQIVRAQLDEQGVDGYRLEPLGGPMSGTWFRVSISIPRPKSYSSPRRSRCSTSMSQQESVQRRASTRQHTLSLR